VWVNYSTEATSGNYSIIGKWGGSYFALYGPNNPQTVAFRLRDHSTARETVVTPLNVINGNWYMLSGTYDKPLIKYYVNNNLHYSGN